MSDTKATKQPSRLPEPSSGRCWFYHTWTRWESSVDLTGLTYIVTDYKTGEKSNVPLQERSCMKCGKTEVRKYDNP